MTQENAPPLERPSNIYPPSALYHIMNWDDDTEKEEFTMPPVHSKGKYITESDPKLRKWGRETFTGLGIYGTVLGSIFLGLGISYCLYFFDHPSDYCIVAVFLCGALIFYFFGAFGWAFSSIPKLVVYENGLALVYNRRKKEFYPWGDMDGFTLKKEFVFGTYMENIKIIMKGEEAITIHEHVPKFDEVVELVTLKLPELDTQESQ